jgi:hypothetical protein
MSTALYPPPISRRWANSPTTSTFVGALGVSLALSSPFRRHKATCSVNSSTPRLGFPRRLFFHFYDTFFSLRHLSLDYSLLHCVANNLSFPLVFLPNLSLRHTVIKRTFTHFLSSSLYTSFRSIPDISYGTNPTFNSRPHSLETISAMSCLDSSGVWRLYEGVSLNTACALQPIHSWTWISRVF